MVSLFPQLADPPIQEVICGFVFKPVQVDSMDFGVYWESRKADYPHHELHPAVTEGGPTIQLGPFPQRSWLISEDKSKILQLQHDRFLVNWRRRGASYPRFSAHEHGGLKRLALDEFERFHQWLQARTGTPLEITRLELTKIDLLVRGKHYENMKQLGDAMKVVRVFQDVQITEPKTLQLRLLEEQPEGSVTQIHILLTPQHVHIETRHAFAATSDLDDTFSDANIRINSVFFGLVDKSLFGASEA